MSKECVGQTFATGGNRTRKCYALTRTARDAKVFPTPLSQDLVVDFSFIGITYFITHHLTSPHDLCYTIIGQCFLLSVSYEKYP